VGENRAFVHNFLDNEVADTNYQTAFDRIVQRLGGQDSRERHADRVEFDSGVDDDSFHIAVVAEPGVMVEDEVLHEDVAAGRRMFFGATDERVAVRGGGVSCSTCHFESRNDGITWQFMDGKARQTPSLAGDLSFQEKFTWTDNVPSVAAEARLTSVDRMGGKGLSVTESRQIETFVNYTWYPDTPLAGVEDERALAGKAIFEREDVACGTCHNGAHLTDQKEYDMLALTGVRTPTLVGIAATGPYLHDGRADSLEQVLQLSDTGQMGDTSMLSETEKADLVYYLKTL
jgi:cytochrome c peroxidase